jgi:DNA-directed RNA polymerase subunit M/transcription elongation factor TFIIS
VKVWNCLRANARRLEGDKPPESEVKNMNQNEKRKNTPQAGQSAKPPDPNASATSNTANTSNAPGQKTETDQLKCPKCGTVFAYYQWQQENWHCPKPECRAEVFPPEPIVLQLRGQKTAQVPGHGPVAGQPEPSIEDRVKTLEQKFESFTQYITNEFTAINAKLDTLIQTKASAPVVAAPVTASVQKTATEWDTEYVNDLPESAFAAIEPGGEKDEQGKTVPRSLRHLEHHNAQGNVDEAHVKAGLQRLNQTKISDALKAEAKKHLCGHAKEMDFVSEFCGEEPQQTTEQVPCGCPKKTENVIATVKPLQSEEEHLIVLTEQEILGVLTDKRRFTPALQLNGILDLLEAKKREVA